MKKRIGFVSNSSSSSFFLGIKDLKEETLLEIFDIQENSIFEVFGKEFVNLLINESKEVDSFELESWEKDNYNKDFLEHCKKNNLKIYTGYFSDEDGNSLESYLRSTSMSVKKDNFIFKLY